MPRVNAVYVNSEIRNNQPSCYDYAKRDDSDSESYFNNSMSSGSYYSLDDYSVSSEDYSDGSTDEDYSDDDDYTADGDYSSGDY